MGGLRVALEVELLKARRSMVLWLTGAGFSILPLVGGLFMYVLKDPERARRMGLIGQKAQLAAGTADWASYFAFLSQGVSVGGMVLFSFVTTWVFGREFADRTMRTVLAQPTPRWAMVVAKWVVIAGWCAVLTGWVFVLGLGVVSWVDVPGGSAALVWRSAGGTALAGGLTILLQPVTAGVASVGRGYLAPVGWIFLVLAAANVLAVLGWGAYFPWAVPAILSGAAGPDAGPVGVGGMVIFGVTAIAGAVGTLVWWERADHVG